MKNINSETVRKDIVESVTNKLNAIGLMFRVFSRSKDPYSLNRKINSDENYGVTKKLQDLVGIRIVLYFNDDIDSVRSIASSMYAERSQDVSIDQYKNDEFKALRYNIVYSLSDSHTEALGLGKLSDKIDNTFELQIRTIFSEGWHEVEHDLRYKCKEDWNGFDPSNRRLNGVYASLETSEWTMIKIFDELAYSHYKGGDISAMIRQKFRLRFSDHNISEALKLILKADDLAKKIFRLDRSEIIMLMNKKDYNFPVTVENFIYFCNLLKIRNEAISSITPNLMKEEILHL